MRLSKMLFFLCFRPTIKFQEGSPVDPLFEPPADPPFWLDLSKISFIVISASLKKGKGTLPPPPPRRKTHKNMTEKNTM